MGTVTKTREEEPTEDTEEVNSIPRPERSERKYLIMIVTSVLSGIIVSLIFGLEIIPASYWGNGPMYFPAVVAGFLAGIAPPKNIGTSHKIGMGMLSGLLSCSTVLYAIFAIISDVGTQAMLISSLSIVTLSSFVLGIVGYFIADRINDRFDAVDIKR